MCSADGADHADEKQKGKIQKEKQKGKYTCLLTGSFLKTHE